MRQHAAALLHSCVQSAATAGCAGSLRGGATATALFGRSACCSSSSASLSLSNAASVSGRCLATASPLHGSLWSASVQRLHAASSPMPAGGHAQGSSLLRQLCRQGQGQIQRQPGCLRGFAAAPEQRSGGWGNAGGPISLKTLIVMMMAGAGILAGTNAYKEEKLKKVTQTSQQVVGKASVGGPFQLTDHNGKPFTDQNLLGEFALLYFGFTFCPDICPDELEKVAQSVDLLEKQTGVKVQPVFISVDPERDTPPKIKEYVAEFHPRMIGLTGDMDAVKRASKQYRVYFSKTGDGGDDYLVDHSIIHYLINPAGEFVTFYAKSFSAEQMAESIAGHLADWQEAHPEYHKGHRIDKPVPAKP